jgi:lipopolysaccharide/colanic/teichoic acid biosynthesis glycosyltransferase
VSFSKRAFDVLGAVGGLLFFGPVMAASALAILFDDGRPILFRQRRLAVDSVRSRS